jgi:hypothetical protein
LHTAGAFAPQPGLGRRHDRLPTAPAHSRIGRTWTRSFQCPRGKADPGTQLARPRIALTASSVVIMPVLGIAKRRLGGRLDSGATAGEGTQNLMCAALAAAVLVGLVVIAVWPSGWPIDPIIALGIAGWPIWEGIQSWHGADSC